MLFPFYLDREYPSVLHIYARHGNGDLRRIGALCARTDSAHRLRPAAIIEEEDTPAGQLALTAQHLGFVLDDGEIDEAEFRSELRQALKNARRTGVVGS